MRAIATNISDNLLNETLVEDLVQDLTIGKTFKSSLDIKGDIDEDPSSDNLSGDAGSPDDQDAFWSSETALRSQRSFEPTNTLPLHPSVDNVFSPLQSPTQSKQTTLPGPGLEYEVIPAPTATINVTYNGFTPEAQTAYQYAVDIVESLFQSPVTIEVDASFTPLGTGVLGSAGPTFINRNFSGAPVSNTWYAVAQANSLAGTDLVPSDGDIVANHNSNFTDWYFGTDGNTPSNKFDFVSHVQHELYHGLGFFDSFDVSGGQGSWGLGTGSPFIFDLFVENGAGQSLIEDFANNSTALGNQLKSNNIFFDGLSTNTANGGPAKLFAPNPYQPGSSIAHLDETTFNGTLNKAMTPIRGLGEVSQQPGPVTFGLFQDLGWDMNTVGWRYGTPGIDSLTGAAAAQNFFGLQGNDSLNGGGGSDFLDGGAGADTIVGSTGNDVLVGGAANDRLTGSAGVDKFLYDTDAAFVASAVGKDTITDFGGANAAGGDIIVLDKETFTTLSSAAGGALLTTEFASVANDAAAGGVSNDIVYSRATDKLFYNPNGTASGFGTGGQFATLTGIANLAATDFLVQA